MSNPPIETVSPFVPLGQIAIMSSASVDTTVTVSLKRRDSSLRVLYFHVLTARTLDVVVSTVVAKLDADAALGFFVCFFALTDVISHFF